MTIHLQAKKAVNYAESDQEEEEDPDGIFKPSSKKRQSRASKRRKLDSDSEEDVFVEDAVPSDLSDEGMSTLRLTEVKCS